jgi:hypothetical protein
MNLALWHHAIILDPADARFNVPNRRRRLSRAEMSVERQVQVGL